MADLTLTLAERMLLANQLRILQRLNPDQDYSLELEIVKNGYEYLYDELRNELIDPPDPTMAPEVYEIFHMFRSLRDSIDILPDKNGIELERAQFRGYDRHEETRYDAFAQFLIERKGPFSEWKPADGNYTPRPILPTYRRMLAVWRSREKSDSLTRTDILTRDEIIQVIAAGQV